jgi:hypothetical protein
MTGDLLNLTFYLLFRVQTLSGLQDSILNQNHKAPILKMPYPCLCGKSIKKGAWPFFPWQYVPGIHASVAWQSHRKEIYFVRNHQACSKQDI